MAEAFLVLGPESSGTRMMTKILLKAGCLGEATHNQTWDHLHFPVGDQPIVFRRSIPHAKKMPDITSIVARMQYSGYDVSVIVTVRDWHAMALSQVSNRHVKSEKEAIMNIRSAYPHIFRFLDVMSNGIVPYYIVSYESIVESDQSINEMLSMIGVPQLSQEGLKELNIYNGNDKWHGV